VTSISFDRAAEFYDRTRVTDDDAVRASVDLLAAELDGPILEVGVGTGALAVPLAARGAHVIGADLSAAMLARLRDKTQVVPVAQADATRLPFADGAFGGAFARHVLHLIGEWRSAVAELCRVVRPGGTVLIEPGGFAGEWRTVWRRFIDELGPDARPVGLDVATHGMAQLDEAFESAGAAARALPAIPLRTDGSLEGFLREASNRTYSWTWRVSDEVLARAVPTVRAWARARYGDLTVPFEPDGQMRWRAYDLPRGPDAGRS
jgi:ubiquinone/menaquinone biosynthesis C-methylase UbiE